MNLKPTMSSLLNGVSMEMVEGASAPGGIWTATTNWGGGGKREERKNDMKIWNEWVEWIMVSGRNQ